jgi:uncharacterized protein (TIGR03067 family)
MAATKRSATGLTIACAFAISAGLGLAVSTTRAFGDDKAQSEALKVFQGSWATDGEGIDSKWTFDGENLKASVNGQDYTCKVTADPSAKPNGTLDLTISDGPEESKGKVSKCIYKLDGEKLTLCVSLPGKDRPKEFAQVDDEAYLFVLKKQKKD